MVALTSTRLWFHERTKESSFCFSFSCELLYVYMRERVLEREKEEKQPGERKWRRRMAWR
jgi:hypothetical protein